MLHAMHIFFNHLFNFDVSFELCCYWSLSGRAPLLIHSLSHRSREFLMLVFTLRLLQHKWCHDAHDVNLRFIHWARPHHSLHPLDGEVHHSHPARWQALLVFFLHFHVFELRFSCISASSSRARLIAPVTKKKQFQWCFKFKQTLFDEFICASWMNFSHLGWSATSTGPGPSSAATHWVELKWPYGGHVAIYRNLKIFVEGFRNFNSYNFEKKLPQFQHRIIKITTTSTSELHCSQLSTFFKHFSSHRLALRRLKTWIFLRRKM